MMINGHHTSLTPIEQARRTAALAAYQTEQEPALSSSYDERRYGKYAADVIRDCKRDVAAASPDSELTVFREVAAKLGQAAADQWLPKGEVAAILNDVAMADGNFGMTESPSPYWRRVMRIEPRALARAFERELLGRNNLVSGQASGRAGRSPSIKLDAAVPDQFLLFSFAGDSVVSRNRPNGTK
jgi:hypothetical protein